MSFIVPYNQLKSQVRKVLGKDSLCIDMGKELEEGAHLEDIDFPTSDKIALILCNDVQSRLLLLSAAKKFPGKIDVVDLKGEFTDYAPLAVSDDELKNCIECVRSISPTERQALIEEFDALPKSQFYQLQQGRITPLTQEEISEYILQQITAPMKLSIAVGLSMGNSPKGWPRTDTFYLEQIVKLAEKGCLEIVGSNEDMMQNTVRPLTRN